MKDDMRAFEKNKSSQVRSCWVWCTADGRSHWMMDEKRMELSFLKKLPKIPKFCPVVWLLDADDFAIG
jgi:hypothetical protein